MDFKKKKKNHVELEFGKLEFHLKKNKILFQKAIHEASKKLHSQVPPLTPRDGIFQCFSFYISKV